MHKTRRMRPLLGTFVEVAMEGSGRDADKAIAASFGKIEELQSLLSFHDPQSELSRLNREALRSRVKVHPWTWRILTMCKQLHAVSHGVFDPSVAARLVENGQLPKPAGHDCSPEFTASFADVEMTKGGEVSFKKPLWLDLGGIAKGFAVDLAILTLRAHGIRQAHVNAGGDLRVIGEKPIPVWLRDPNAPSRTFPAGMLKNAACATSGGYFNDQRHWAIVSAQTGDRPQLASVTVLARTCMVADALTKIVALVGPDKADTILAQFEATSFTELPQ